MDSGQRGARVCNGDCDGDVLELGCGAVTSNESCGALGPGSNDVMTWWRKPVVGEGSEPVRGRSVEGSVTPSVNMDGVPCTGTKCGARKFAGSEGIKELGLGPPDQAVAYSDGGTENGGADGGCGGGVLDECESEGELTS